MNDCSIRGLIGVASLALLLLLAPPLLHAEDGSAAWLRYAPVNDPSEYKALPAHIIVLGDTPSEHAAGIELQKGLSSMLGRHFDLRFESTSTASSSDSIVIGSSTSNVVSHDVGNDLPLKAEQYRITVHSKHGKNRVVIVGGTPQAELYGAFHLLEEIAAERRLPIDESQSPAAPIRWTDEWNNLNGTIERGYAGPSIFFEAGHVRQNLTRAAQYARLLASVGMNGCNVNNVNADLDLLTTEHLREFAHIADAFRPWGVKLALSVDLTSPQTVGGLSTFDPLDPAVAAWWRTKADEIYALIPDFGGFTVKADSEGRKGPSQYGRNPADAANVLARALAPHHGIVLYRGFIYNNHLDWLDPKADRARAGVDNFVRYNGQFDTNVIIQIKEGPIDFQAREPVSPLFGALTHSNMAIEVETSQEYTGQQRHMVWLPTMWKWVLDTDLRVGNRSTPVKEIVEGRSFPLADGQPRPGGFISVTNVGMDANWLHHPMALANLYGFGKLAWNPDQPMEEIIDSWTRLTWGTDPQVDQTIDTLQLRSWNIYEGYTGPNGMGTLTNILGYHFGPGIESAERNGWGQWFRGENDGIGMDRTSSGTGYVEQYPPELAARYESLATCPDDLLLFFHHVPYDYKLHSGKTLVQSIYDTHYASANAAAEYVPQWKSLKGKIDDERYQKVLALFNFQAGHAIVWRDAINHWFERISGIPDAQGRIEHDSNRIEAESMQPRGYEAASVSPWETASGGKAMVCRVPDGCSLTTQINQPAGLYDIAVQYFDTWHGVSHYSLSVNGTVVASWTGDDTLPPAQFDLHLDGQDSTRFTTHAVALKPGDTLTVHGIPDLRSELNSAQAIRSEAGALAPDASEHRDYREYAPIDYLEFGPNSAVTPQ
jgi:alpha-glucuronidase